MIIAQISDTHLRTDGGLLFGKVDPLPALKAALAHLRALEPRPDVVLATGDLVNTPNARDYGVLRRMFDGLGMPVYVIPGNHDGRAEMRELFADWGYLPNGGDFLQYTVEDHPLRLIGLDTVIPGQDGGCMCADRLAWLDARLGDAPDRPTLIFMHHPPFRTGIAFMDRLGFDGGPEMEAVVRRHPQVEWVLCGHIHRQIQVRWGGTTASTAPSTVFQMSLDLVPGSPSSFVLEPAGCPLYAWSPELGLRAYLSVIGDFGPRYPFVHDPV